MHSREMTCPWCRMLIVCVVALTDVGVYVYDAHIDSGISKPPTSYPAHIAGAITGFLVGIVALKNLRWERHERYIWIASVSTFVALTLFAVCWNLAATKHFVGLPLELIPDCISQEAVL